MPGCLLMWLCVCVCEWVCVCVCARCVWEFNRFLLKHNTLGSPGKIKKKHILFTSLKPRPLDWLQIQWDKDKATVHKRKHTCCFSPPFYNSRGPNNAGQLYFRSRYQMRSRHCQWCFLTTPTQRHAPHHIHANKQTNKQTFSSYFKISHSLIWRLPVDFAASMLASNMFTAPISKQNPQTWYLPRGP